MSDNSKIAKNSLILYIKFIFGSIIGLLSSRFILQALGASDFGLYNVVGGIVFIMALLNNVMVSTTYRFIAYELGIGDEKKVNNVFNISLIIHILLACIVIFLAETIGIYYIKNHLNVAFGKVDDALFVFRFSILTTIISILSVPLQGLITAMEKFVVTSSIEILRGLLALGVILLIRHYTGNRLKIYSILIAVISMIPPVIYFIYSQKYHASLIKWNFQKEKNKYGEMVRFSGWIMFGASAGAAEIQGSAIIINLFFGTILNASYGIAGQVNNMVKMFSQSLNQAVIPQITKSTSLGNTNRTMQLVIFSSKYSFLLMLLLALPIFLETDFILKLWLKNVPVYTTVFIQLMIVNALLAAMNAGIPAAVQATGKIKYFQIITSIVSLMGLPVSYILFKLGQAPYTLLLTYTFIAILNLFVMQILLKMLISFDIKQFFLKVYLKLLIIVVVVSPLFLIKIFFASSIIRFFGSSIISILWLLTAIYLFGMEKNEKELIKSFIPF